MIAKTKDKKEQGDMMIAAAKQFQQEHNGKLPSVMDMAHQLDTSQWTISSRTPGNASLPFSDISVK